MQSTKKEEKKERYEFVPKVKKSDLSPVRNKIWEYIQSFPIDSKIDHKLVMKVKGKCLN